MPWKGSKKRDYAINKSKRHRIKREAKHKHERFGFRKTMLRSLDDLELGGNLPSYAEMKELFDNEEATIRYCLEKEIFDCPSKCPRCSQPVKEPTAKWTVRCRRVECAFKCPTQCQRCEGDDLHITLDSNQEPSKADCGDCHWQWRPGL